jgi:hypothetical protein
MPIELLMPVSMIATVILLFVVIGYFHARIARKYGDKTPFWQFFIPLWTYYLIARIAVTKPAHYTIFWLILIPILIRLLVGLQLSWTAGLAQGLAFLHLYARLASGLGKSYWKYLLLGIIPVVAIVQAGILAFDGSRPIDQSLMHETPE